MTLISTDIMTWDDYYESIGQSDVEHNMVTPFARYGRKYDLGDDVILDIAVINYEGKTNWAELEVTVSDNNPRKKFTWVCDNVTSYLMPLVWPACMSKEVAEYILHMVVATYSSEDYKFDRFMVDEDTI